MIGIGSMRVPRTAIRRRFDDVEGAKELIGNITHYFDGKRTGYRSTQFSLKTDEGGELRTCANVKEPFRNVSILLFPEDDMEGAIGNKTGNMIIRLGEYCQISMGQAIDKILQLLRKGQPKQLTNDSCMLRSTTNNRFGKKVIETFNIGGTKVEKTVDGVHYFNGFECIDEYNTL